jgi:ABC-type transport system involved in multi-copper enzyme maturation permease subunit
MMGLLIEDLKAAFRTKWSWILLAGASLFLFLFNWGPGAFDIDIYLKYAYIYLPLFLIVISSLQISSERSSRFANILFTYPISKKQYYASKFILILLFGGIYLAMTLPFSYLYYHFMGGWFLSLFWKYLSASIIILFFATSLGLLISVSLEKGSNSSLAIGFATTFILSMMVTFFLFVIDSSVVDHEESLSEGGKLVISLFHLSPVICLYDFFGFHNELVAVHKSYSLVLPIFYIFLFTISGYIIFKKLQSIEGFDCSHKKKLIATISIFILILVPAVFANHEYEEKPEEPFEVETGVYEGIHVYFIRESEWPLTDQEIVHHPSTHVYSTIPYEKEKRAVALLMLTCDENITILHNVTIKFSSDEIYFNRTISELSSMEVKKSVIEKMGYRIVMSYIYLPITLEAHQVYAIKHSYLHYSVNLTSDEITGWCKDDMGVEVEGFEKYPMMMLAILLATILFFSLLYSFSMRR